MWGANFFNRGWQHCDNGAWSRVERRKIRGEGEEEEKGKG